MLFKDHIIGSNVSPHHGRVVGLPELKPGGIQASSCQCMSGEAPGWLAKDAVKE